MMEGENLVLKISLEEMGVLLVALATLHGLQGIKQPNRMTTEERDYSSATDSLMRKCCLQAGLPEKFLQDLRAQAFRELMVRKSKAQA